MSFSRNPRVGVLLLCGAGAVLALGCSTPQAGGQTGDEDGGRECHEIARSPVTAETEGPGGFSAAATLEQLQLSHDTAIELPAGEEVTGFGEIKLQELAAVSVQLSSDDWNWVDYDRPNSAETGVTCESKLAAAATVTVAVDGQAVLGPLECTLALSSETYAQFEGSVAWEQLAGSVRDAAQAEDSGDKLTLSGGVSALGTWGRVSVADSAALSPHRTLLAWPRDTVCGDGGFPVLATEAEKYLADPGILHVEIAGDGGETLQQEWQLSFDSGSSCLTPAGPDSAEDVLVVSGEIEVRDVATGAATPLAAVLRVPAIVGAAGGFEATVVGPCTSLGEALPDTFAQSCGDWHIDLSGYEAAHLQLAAQFSPEQGLEGHVRVFGDTPADCVDARAEQQGEGRTSGDSCTGTESTLLGELNLAGMISQ